MLKNITGQPEGDGYLAMSPH